MPKKPLHFRCQGGGYAEKEKIENRRASKKKNGMVHQLTRWENSWQIVERQHRAVKYSMAGKVLLSAEELGSKLGRG